MESPTTVEREIRPSGRPRSPKSVTAAEKAQAREVSLRRIGRLFTPYRWQLIVVTVIIAVSSVVGLVSPFLLRAVIDVALPDRNVSLLVWLVLGMVGVAGVTSVLGVGGGGCRPGSARRSVSRSCTACAQPSSATCSVSRSRSSPAHAPVRCSRGSPMTSAAWSRSSPRRQPRSRPTSPTAIATSVGDGRTVLAALAHLAGGHAAGDLADPQGRQDAPRHHRDPAGRARQSQRHGRGGVSRSAGSSWPKRLGQAPR